MTNCLDIALGQDYRTVKVVKNIPPKEPKLPQPIEQKQTDDQDKKSKKLKLAIAGLAVLGFSAIIIHDRKTNKLKEKGKEILKESQSLFNEAQKTKDQAKMFQEGANKIINKVSEEISKEIIEKNGKGILDEASKIYSMAGENSNLIADYQKCGQKIDIKRITITIKNKFRTIINCDTDNKVKSIAFGVQDGKAAGQFDYGQISTFAKNVIKKDGKHIPETVYKFNGEECSKIINNAQDNLSKGLTAKEFIFKNKTLDTFVDSGLKDAEGKIIKPGKVYKFKDGVLSTNKRFMRFI